MGRKVFFFINYQSVKSWFFVFISWINGEKLTDAVGLTKKIFLLKEKIEDRSYIIDINITDFRLIKQGHSLLELIDSKMKALRTDTNFEKFLQLKHPALEEGEK